MKGIFFLIIAISFCFNEAQAKNKNPYKIRALRKNCLQAFSNMGFKDNLTYIYEKDELISILKEVREKMKGIAYDKTAFDSQDYRLAMQNPQCNPLRGHCGAAVYTIQFLFGGEAKLLFYQSENGKEFWHMYNKNIPYRNEGDSNTKIKYLDVDLTKGQLDNADEATLTPMGDVIVYDGLEYKLVEQWDYKWEEDKIGPLRPQIITFFTRFLTDGKATFPAPKDNSSHFD